MPPRSPTVAFLGATGGCTSTALALSLQAGRDCTALVRTPSKLLALLRATHAVPQSVLDARLTVVQGDARDAQAVARALAAAGRVADVVVSGVGGAPRMQASAWAPLTLDDPKVCGDGMIALLGALRALGAGTAAPGPRREGERRRPVVVAISTTGLAARRDVPWLLVPLYHWLLAVPHRDKKRMEELLVEGSRGADPVCDFVVVRPTLLVDGAARGREQVRVGWERASGATAGEEGPGPAVGYTVSRADVGRWVFEEVVKGGRTWVGRCVTLTY